MQSSVRLTNGQAFPKRTVCGRSADPDFQFRLYVSRCGRPICPRKLAPQGPNGSERDRCASGRMLHAPRRAAWENSRTPNSKGACGGGACGGGIQCITYSDTRSRGRQLLHLNPARASAELYCAYSFHLRERCQRPGELTRVSTYSAQEYALLRQAAWLLLLRPAPHLLPTCYIMSSASRAIQCRSSSCRCLSLFSTCGGKN